jgi:NDP-sugar pyrophosphorylase family protein
VRVDPDLCALVLAAGQGRRLRPITETVPKPLCPVGNVPLLDRALDRLAAHGLAGSGRVAVNASYLADQIAAHAGGRAFISTEPEALGTAGAVGHLRDWAAGRAVLVGNGDAYLAPDPASADPGHDLAALLHGWDGETVRVLVVPAADPESAEFHGPAGPAVFAGFSLIPASVAAALAPVRSELVREVWRPAERDGRLELIRYDGLYLDTGTVPDYLAANLHAAGAGSLIAPDAVVTGRVERCVVGAAATVGGTAIRCVIFPGAVVAADEMLVDAVRVGTGLTVTAVPAAAPGAMVSGSPPSTEERL